ncbi:class I SAM-dependent methyltransferase [Rhodopirellula bahusiensis]|uniref:SAM-dependent methyltransferase n=1 Tax=Rhodopirellula bahusiensis TaxID=2014065 RepID=A0A2G1W5B0_9BACT|nr:class I SAM-dependent methyltransferase [Rhodopirellula bahusiensis]PHQ34233.1 SAM-dependent methyltransferase [Rhodopirellula bahusiensis]
MKCRHCHHPLTLPFVELGSAPPSNAYLTQESLLSPEKWFPLRVLVCEQCWLVQTEDFSNAEELFDSQYAYFSGFSTSWLTHSEKYVHEMIERFSLDQSSHVVEVAANDGYLLQYVQAAGVPCLGIEPTASTAQAAREKGIEVVEQFFGVALATELVEQGKRADLTAANNVLAHVPDINDFVRGFSILLRDDGVATFEFPHLVKLVQESQFDTIYHEHFSYLSLTAVKAVFESNGLQVFDVQPLNTHGGSLRVFAQRTETGQRAATSGVNEVLQSEASLGLTTTDFYLGFQKKTNKVKDEFIRFLIDAKKAGKSVAAYGAAAKGNTLLNYAGIRPDLIQFVVDRNPAKQDKYMPGSRIPIVNEDELRLKQPDYIVVLPWNLLDEIANQLDYTRQWNAQLVSAIPSLKIL